MFKTKCSLSQCARQRSSDQKSAIKIPTTHAQGYKYEKHKKKNQTDKINTHFKKNTLQPNTQT